MTHSTCATKHKAKNRLGLQCALIEKMYSQVATLTTLLRDSSINSHYAFLFRKFSRTSQPVHIHTLSCAGFIHDSFFRLRSLVFFGISAVHLAQLGNRQRWHMYLLLSLNIASSFGFKAVGFCLQSDDLHVNPRQILHVVHAGLLHAGCKLS